MSRSTKRHYKRNYSNTRTNFNYVCEPHNMRILVEIAPSAHGKINVTLFIDEKEALFGTYRVKNLDSATLNDRVATFCTGIAMFSEDDIRSYVAEDRSVLARSAKRYLKEVRNKLGTLIWRR